MTVRHIFLTAALALTTLLSVSSPARAQTASAAWATVYTEGVQPVNGSDSAGGEGFLDAKADLNNIDGNGGARATLAGSVNLPTLGAKAFSTASSTVEAIAVGMQGFFLGSGASSPITLNLTLTGTATEVGFLVGKVRAGVLVFKDANPVSHPEFGRDNESMGEIVLNTPDLTFLGGTDVSVDSTGTQQTVQSSVSFAGLATGDLFYVWAGLVASGRAGTSGDAFNSLHLDFSDPTGLSQTAPVPEPGTWLLMALGLGALAGLVRRRRC